MVLATILFVCQFLWWFGKCLSLPRDIKFLEGRTSLFADFCVPHLLAQCLALSTGSVQSWWMTKWTSPGQCLLHYVRSPFLRFPGGFLVVLLLPRILLLQNSWFVLSSRTLSAVYLFIFSCFLLAARKLWNKLCLALSSCVGLHRIYFVQWPPSCLQLMPPFLIFLYHPFVYFIAYFLWPLLLS